MASAKELTFEPGTDMQCRDHDLSLDGPQFVDPAAYYGSAAWAVSPAKEAQIKRLTEQFLKERDAQTEIR